MISSDASKDRLLGLPGVVDARLCRDFLEARVVHLERLRGDVDRLHLVWQARGRVLAGGARHLDGLVDQRVDGVLGEVGGVGRGGAPADEDPHAERLAAGFLERLHLALAHGDLKTATLADENVGAVRTRCAGAVQEVVGEIELVAHLVGVPSPLQGERAG